MIAPTKQFRFQMDTYTNGQPYSPAQGRYAPRQRLEDRLEVQCAVVNQVKRGCHQPGESQRLPGVGRGGRIG